MRSSATRIFIIINPSINHTTPCFRKISTLIATGKYLSNYLGYYVRKNYRPTNHGDYHELITVSS